MTDSEGILQFSDKNKPLIDSGYTIDDNARALIVALDMESIYRDKLLKIYANFLKNAQTQDGIWYNLKVRDKFYSILNSDDSIGRGLMAASFAIDCKVKEVEDIMSQILDKFLLQATELNSPRTMAYVLLGISNLINVNKYADTDILLKKSKIIIKKLIKLYKNTCDKGWHWFEDRITYCNAVLPHSLFAYYTITGDKKACEVAKDTLGFLTDSLFKRGFLTIVGNKGWWIKNKEMPLYDQQPVDAASIVLACLQAFIAIGDRQYLEKAKKAYDWYWGNNINGISLYNKKTEGCHDALTPDGVNLNQGAEAITSFLISHHLIYAIEKRSMQLIPAV